MASEEPETYFSNEQLMFPHLEADKIPTDQFLNACQGIADFVGFLGTAFSPVKSDISGNVLKVRTRFEKNREGQKYLQDLIDADLAEHGGKLGIATEGLLWLKRGLEFMLQMLSLMVQEYRADPDPKKAASENLTSILQQSYDRSLKRHHNFMAKQLFKVLIHAAPYRKTILKAVALGKDGLDEVCVGHIESHLENFRTNVSQLVVYYIEKRLESPA